jgi:hypothetical protein
VEAAEGHMVVKSRGEEEGKTGERDLELVNSRMNQAKRAKTVTNCIAAIVSASSIALVGSGGSGGSGNGTGTPTSDVPTTNDQRPRTNPIRSQPTPARLVCQVADSAGLPPIDAFFVGTVIRTVKTAHWGVAESEGRHLAVQRRLSIHFDVDTRPIPSQASRSDCEE